MKRLWEVEGETLYSDRRRRGGVHCLSFPWVYSLGVPSILFDQVVFLPLLDWTNPEEQDLYRNRDSLRNQWLTDLKAAATTTAARLSDMFLANRHLSLISL
jgi:hypothetical protein